MCRSARQQDLGEVQRAALQLMQCPKSHKLAADLAKSDEPPVLGCELGCESSPASSLDPNAPMMHPSRPLSRALRTFSTSSSTRAAATYTPPLKPGVLPAYDAALAYLAQDRSDKLKRLDQLKQEGNKDVEQQHVLEKLEVEAWANDPETRWRANSGNGERATAPFFLTRWEGMQDWVGAVMLG